MLLKELFLKIRDYFYKLFHPVIFNLNDEYSDILEKRAEFTKKNVLVGTVRRREQLSVNLTHKFYHIPMSQLITADDIEYIAIYQSKNIFRENTDINGVVFLGEVKNAQLVKRCDIPEIPSASNEMYMRFDVKDWQRLNPHIQIREISPHVCMKTSFYQLANARFINELFFDTADKYVFFLGIIDIINNIYDGFDLNSFRVVRRSKRITVKSGKNIRTFSVRDLSSKPYTKITEIFEKS